MTLRVRTLLSLLSVVMISGGVCSLIGGHLLWKHLDQEAQNRVRQDLNAAKEFYNHRLEVMGSALLHTALGERFSQAVAGREANYLSRRLALLRGSASLDILYVTDAEGRVLYRAHRPGVSGDRLAEDRLVRSVLGGAGTITGTIVVNDEALRRESPALAERARIPVVSAVSASAPGGSQVDGGMMLCAASPVRDEANRLVGVLRGGVLLNQNPELVDQVQDTVFHGELYGGKPLGTATIFQNDVRISTNVLRQDGSRAIGTRVSQEVYDCVLGQGRPWLGRAWVVNDWYVSAYAPIHDLDQAPIGMLYVGVQQGKFRDMAMGTWATFAAVTVVGVLAAGLLAWKLANSIARPVRALALASEAIARGHFTQKVSVESCDELSALARTFNTMAQSLHQRDELLKQQTRQQLTRSERLAAVGRLAAGVAHEINNPLTGVLTFSHMLLKDVPANSQQHQDVQAIIEATTRCRDIIRGLLNFSRQNEPHKRPCDLNAVLKDALALTRNQAHLDRVAIVEELDGRLPQVVIDPYQVQEVAVNVILNAIDAMGEGGTLTVRTRGAQEDGAPWVEFEIADTGCGIPPENLERIFDPFFTTKPPGKGTGLGLAISYGIVAEHGGEIRVASQAGNGTTVTVRLPAAKE
jgi:two-component system NtrC family sensor kinase